MTPSKATYIIEFNGKASFIEMPKGAPSEYWAEVQRKFATENGCSPSERFPYADLWRCTSHDRHKGVPYSWELSGSSGASFMVFAADCFPSEDIQECIDYIRRERDCVNLEKKELQLVSFELPPLQL